MIPQSFIQDLLHRVDIVDVIERYIPLKRAGANYVACCPFHSEKTPSFTVSPVKQFYHCFGCGAHGTAVSFVMEYGGNSFVEAVKQLAGNVGMEVPEEKNEHPGAKSKDEQLPELMQAAAQYYKKQLKQSEKAINYLRGRGLSGEVAARYGLGYAPDSWQNLSAIFPDYQQNKALVTAGLVIANEPNKRYDRFRDRIIFPIINMRGTTIGFGGRVLDQGEPKYLNSPETPLFEKGRELYGLFQARQAIREANRVVVVEGYMDVVALAQYGVTYAVATLGTATTPAHVQKLLRQSDEVVFCFDGDAAGQRAAWRALENSLSQLVDGKQLSFLFLPKDEDPDSFIRKNGKQAFEQLLDNTIPLSAFLLKELSNRVDLQTQEGRAKLLHDAKPLIKQISAPILNTMLRKRLAELTGLSQQELDNMYQIKTETKARIPEKARKTQPSIVRKLIEMLMLEPQLARLASIQTLVKAEAPKGIPAIEMRLLIAVLEACNSGPTFSISETFRGTEYETLVQQIESHLLQWPEDWDQSQLETEFSGAWDQLMGLLRKSRIDFLEKKYQYEGLSSWSPEDKSEYRQLQQRLSMSTEG